MLVHHKRMFAQDVFVTHDSWLRRMIPSAWESVAEKDWDQQLHFTDLGLLWLLIGEWIVGSRVS